LCINFNATSQITGIITEQQISKIIGFSVVDFNVFGN
jgi:hypothetical protein